MGSLSLSFSLLTDFRTRSKYLVGRTTSCSPSLEGARSSVRKKSRAGEEEVRLCEGLSFANRIASEEVKRGASMPTSAPEITGRFPHSRDRH